MAYTVILQQSPELAARQAQADEQHSPHNGWPTVQPAKPWTEMRPETARLMQRVTVTSMAYLAAQDIRPENEVQRRKLQAILDAGPTYESCVFFQGMAR